MATTIILKKSLTAGDVPLDSQLNVGELAVNIPDRKIYTLDGGSVVRRLDGAYVSASAPSNPVEGDLWYDTSTNLLKTYNGSSFASAGYSTLEALEDVNLTSAGANEFLVYDGAEWINKTWAEADIQQASETVATSRNSISVTDNGGDGSLSYNSTTGAITYTGPSAAEVRAHFSGGTGISLTSGAIAIDFSEFTTDSLVEGVSNIFFTDERVDDRVAQLITAGTNISSTYDDTAGTLTIAIDSTGGLDLSNNDTDDVSEGSTNLYFTTARARNSISVTDAGGDGSLSYNSATGVITYTGPSASEVRAHFTGGTGVDITNGQVSIGQDVSTTSDVTFNDLTLTGIVYGPASMVIDPSAHGDNTGSVTIKGDLIVDGTTTSVNSNEVNIGDSIIVLNYDEAGTPSQNAGFTVERGTSSNVSFLWNETDDAWDMDNETLQNVTIDGGSY